MVFPHTPFPRKLVLYLFRASCTGACRFGREEQLFSSRQAPSDSPPGLYKVGEL